MRNDRRKSGSYRHGVTNDLTRRRNIDVTNPSEFGNYVMQPIKNLKLSRTHKLSSSKISCSNGSTLTKVLLNTDEYPSETMWHIYEATSSNVVEVASYTSLNKLHLESFCLEADKCYSFVISDSSRNGICCGESHGSYQLYYGGILVQEGSDFISSETSLPFGICSASNLSSATPSNNPTLSTNNSPLKPLRLTSSTPVPTSQEPTNQDTSGPTSSTSSTSPPSPSTSTSAYPTTNGCPNTETLVHVVLTTDDYPYETVWNIKERTSPKKVKKYDSYNDLNKVHKDTFCLNTNACYVFEITDSYGDGICCNKGNGSYQLFYDGILVQEGGNFTDSETSPPFGSCSTSNLPSATPSNDITKTQPSRPPSATPLFTPVPTSPPSSLPPAKECPNGETKVHITLTTDNNPNETKWNIKERTSSDIVHKNKAYTNRSTVHNEDYCLNTNMCYVFVIFDSDDGICCNKGNGSYQLFYGGYLVQEGSNFTDSETSPPFGSCSTSKMPSTNPTTKNPSDGPSPSSSTSSNIPSTTPSKSHTRSHIPSFSTSNSDTPTSYPSNSPSLIPSILTGSRPSSAPFAVPSGNPSAVPNPSWPKTRSKDHFESKPRVQPTGLVAILAGVVIFLWIIGYTGRILWLKSHRFRDI